MGAPQGNQNAAGPHSGSGGSHNPNWEKQHHVAQVEAGGKWGVFKGSMSHKDIVSLHNSRSSAHGAARKLNGPQATAMRAHVLRGPP